MPESRHRLRRPKAPKPPKQMIGWREWVALPDLGVGAIKAKIDTGARSSALHAWNIEPFERDGRDWLAFDLHPLQRDNGTVVTCAAPLIDRRPVRNSGGFQEERFVIRTSVGLAGETWPIEITLTNRDEMGFRLLLGRTALRRRFLVDPGRSFLVGRIRKPERRPQAGDRPSTLGVPS